MLDTLEQPTAADKLDAWNERRLPTALQPDDYRTPEEVDYARVIHSASFRRLQGKTQIINISDGDFHRTRLTHSLEVSQVATGILAHIRNTTIRQETQAALPSRTLMETICMVHDLGHPPFGHGGEVGLNFAMREHGGFEGNGQTLRILTKLEIFAPGYGSNLTRRTLLGVLKYPVAYSKVAPREAVAGVKSPINGEVLLDRHLHEPPKCYMDSEQDIVDWLIEPLSPSDTAQVFRQKAKSLDCTIMDLADDIAYGVHDLEDAISLRLIRPEHMTDFINPSLWGEFLDRMAARYPAEYENGLMSRYDAFCAALFSRDPATTKKQIGRLVGYMISNCRIATRDEFECPLYHFKATMLPAALELLTALKRFIFKQVILAPQLQQMRFKGQRMIISIFTYLNHDPEHLLPREVYATYAAAGDVSAQQRVICDYIASMTDASLIQTYERFTSPRAGSAFDHM